MAADVKIRVLAEDRAKRQLGNVDQALGTLVRTLGTVTAAAYAAKKAFDFAQEGAQINRLEQSGQALADQYGQSMSAIVSSIKSASGATIDEMTAMQAANASMALGVAKTPEQFERLTKASIALGRAQGRTALESINDLSTGIGRQSKLILDNLGITYDANTLYNEYAESIGTTAAALSDAEKKQALLNLALEQAQPLLAENGDLIEDQAAQYEKLTANWKDLTNEWKRRGANIVAPVINRAGMMVNAYNDLDNALSKNLITEEEHIKLRKRVKYHLSDQADVTEFLTERTDGFSAAAAVANKRLEDQTFAADAASEALQEMGMPAEIVERRLAGISARASDAAAAVDNEFVPAWEQSIGAFDNANQRLSAILQHLYLIQGVSRGLSHETIASTMEQGVAGAANLAGLVTGGGGGGFASGGVLGSRGDMAVVGEEGYEYAFKDKNGNWVIIPHQQSKNLARMGVVPGRGLYFGGPLDGGGGGPIPDDPYLPGSGGVKVPGGGLSAPIPPGPGFPTLGGGGGGGTSGSTSTSTQETQKAASQAATTAAQSVGQQTVAAQVAVSAQSNQQFLGEFRQQMSQDRQEFVELLNKLNTRLDRLPTDISDSILAVSG